MIDSGGFGDGDGGMSGYGNYGRNGSGDGDGLGGSRDSTYGGEGAQLVAVEVESD